MRSTDCTVPRKPRGRWFLFGDCHTSPACRSMLRAVFLHGSFVLRASSLLPSSVFTQRLVTPTRTQQLSIQWITQRQGRRVCFGSQTTVIDGRLRGRRWSSWHSEPKQPRSVPSEARIARTVSATGHRFDGDHATAWRSLVNVGSTRQEDHRCKRQGCR